MRRFVPAFCLAILAFAVAALPAMADTPQDLIIAAGASRYRFAVEIADEPAERERGLMFRTQLAANAGMLFLYSEAAERRYWMHNTPLSLDLLFIGADGRILSIARRAPPMTDDPILSQGKAKAVLEVNGGTADALGIREGDLVLYPGLGAE